MTLLALCGHWNFTICGLRIVETDHLIWRPNYPTTRITILAEVWLNHLSAREWASPSLWRDYFGQAEMILNAKLTLLDVSDPVKRRVASLDDAAAYASEFAPNQTSRHLFGKFGDIGIEFSIRQYKRPSPWPNSLVYHLSPAFMTNSDGAACITRLFDAGNRSLFAFYSFCDFREVVIRKRKKSGAVDINSELLGAFWLTYFNSAYVEFFGRHKFRDLPNCNFGELGQATIKLANTPASATDKLREGVMQTLGRDSFVDVEGDEDKPIGKFALTLEQLG